MASFVWPTACHAYDAKPASDLRVPTRARGLQTSVQSRGRRYSPDGRRSKRRHAPVRARWVATGPYQLVASAQNAGYSPPTSPDPSPRRRTSWPIGPQARFQSLAPTRPTAVRRRTNCYDPPRVHPRRVEGLLRTCSPASRPKFVPSAEAARRRLCLIARLGYSQPSFSHGPLPAPPLAEDAERGGPYGQ